MKYVLETLAKVMAPFMPFMSEAIWQKVTGFDFVNEKQSVHLENWPSVSNSFEKIDKEVFVIYEVDELFAMLDECLANLNNILGSRYLKNSRSKVEKLQ